MMKHLSVVGQGYHTDEKVVGFYNTGDRIKLWGKRGAFWGGLWGLLFGAAVVGGLSVLGGALYSIGIPKDSVIAYEAAIKANGFLKMAHGSAEETARAKAILENLKPSRVDFHACSSAQNPLKQAVG